MNQPEIIFKMSSPKSVGVGTKNRKLDPASIDRPRSYLEPVLETHLNLLKQGTFSDVTFTVGERKERIPCHQLFLKARSPVFEVMFSERWSQDTAKEVSLEDFHPKTFRKFLLFVYTDTLEADVPETLELLQLAHKYDVQLLASKCEKLLENNVTLDNALDVFQAAQIYEKKKLLDKVGDLWAKSMYKMQAHPSFAQLDKPSLMYILRRNDLKMKEVDLFRLALQWAQNQRDATVKESLEDILPLIRFPTMTLNEFSTTVVPTALLPPSTFIELFKYIRSDDKAKKSLARTLGFSTQERRPKKAFVFVPLYPEVNITDKITKWHEFQNFKESLHFYSRSQCKEIGLAQPTLGFGFKAISLYCPAKATTTAPRPPAATVAHPSFKTFRLCFKSKNCYHRQLDLYSNKSYKELFNSSFVQVEGEMRDIKLPTVIPLSKDKIYCITVEEEITGSQGGVSVQCYNTKDFGNDAINAVAVNIDNVCDTALTVQRNHLHGFVQNSYEPSRPRLICKLGFQEL